MSTDFYIGLIIVRIRYLQNMKNIEFFNGLLKAMGTFENIKNFFQWHKTWFISNFLHITTIILLFIYAQWRYCLVSNIRTQDRDGNWPFSSDSWNHDRTVTVLTYATDRLFEATFAQDHNLLNLGLGHLQLTKLSAKWFHHSRHCKQSKHFKLD